MAGNDSLGRACRTRGEHNVSGFEGIRRRHLSNLKLRVHLVYPQGAKTQLNGTALGLCGHNERGAASSLTDQCLLTLDSCLGLKREPDGSGTQGGQDCNPEVQASFAHVEDTITGPYPSLFEMGADLLGTLVELSVGEQAVVAVDSYVVRVVAERLLQLLDNGERHVWGAHSSGSSWSTEPRAEAGRMSVQTCPMCSRQATLVPAKPSWCHPEGRSRVIGQTEYCSSSFIATMWSALVVSSLNSLILQALHQIFETLSCLLRVAVWCCVRAVASRCDRTGCRGNASRCASFHDRT